MQLTHQDIRTYQAPFNCLTNKTILVTGASSGIGLTAAVTYASYGARVLLLGRNKNKLLKVYQTIINNGDIEPIILTMDLATASMDDMLCLTKQIQHHTKKLDGVLHNASVLGDIGTLKDYDVTLLNKVMQVNFTSTFMLTKALFPLIEQANNASVIFTTSSVGSKPRALWGAYALSKQITEGMSEILTQETTNSNLRFNCINPGGTRTTMRAKAYPDEDPNLLKTPKDIMPAYLCLMNEDSLNIKGQIISLQPKK